MSYNPQPRGILKQPENSVISVERPRKKPRLSAQLSTRRSNRVENILNRQPSRSLCLFETLFSAYPIAQGITEALSTRDLIVLSITTPVLRYFLKSQGVFRTFSNHYEVINIGDPLASHPYRRFSGSLWYKKSYKNFGSTTQLKKLIATYLDPEILTSLILDDSSVDISTIRDICRSAKALSLLSLQLCKRIRLAGIQLLLECPKDVEPELDTFIPLVKTLRIWGLPATEFEFVPSTRANARKTVRRISQIMEICEDREIDLDIIPCCRRTQCQSLLQAREGYNRRVHRYSISDNSIWMCERTKAKCGGCGDIQQIECCNECMQDPERGRSIDHIGYGFCATCKNFFCDDEECHGVFEACIDCGFQCKSCLYSKSLCCSACLNLFCATHSDDPASKLKNQCDHCQGKFCDNCAAFYCCVYCRDTGCIGCMSAFLCGICSHGLCKRCVVYGGMATGNQAIFEANIVPKRGWYCDCCIDFALSEEAAGRRAPESGTTDFALQIAHAFDFE